MTASRTRNKPLTTEEEIVHYLFEDIARLPIITNRAQEFWLGIQLKTAERIDALIRSLAQNENDFPIPQNGKAGPRTLPSVVAKTFVDACSQLTAAAAETYWSTQISVDEWAHDLLVARRKIYNLHHSQLRRLLDQLKREPDSLQVAQLIEGICNTVELLALLPDPLLGHLSSTAHHDAIDLDELLTLFPSGLDDAAYLVWLKQSAERAKHELVTGYLRYAVRVARNEYTGQLDISDLVQHGFLGLIRAAERYDYRINARFGTYATSWIWQSIGRAQSEQGSLVRMPVHVRDKLDKLARLTAQHDSGLDDPLADPELLVEAGFLSEKDARLIRFALVKRKAIDEEALERLNAVARRVSRLVLQVWGTLPLGADAAMLDTREDEPAHAPLEDRLPLEPEKDGHSLQEMVRRLLSRLTEREQEVIELRFGLIDGRERTLEQIGVLSGVTRERIRQIERKAMLKFEDYFLKDRRAAESARSLLMQETWSIPQLSLPPVYPAELLLKVAGPSNEHRYAWLDGLLTQLPRSSWHARSHGVGRIDSRAQQLADALATLGAPSHYARIVEQANELASTRSPLEDFTGYNVMVNEEKDFILLGNGVFSLVDWEQVRARQREPQLPFCPLALPDPPGFEGALFESIFVGHQFLRREPTAAEFLTHMLRWAEADPALKPWLRQSFLSTYYLLGLIPYTFAYAGDNPQLRTTLPHEDIQELRRYCLGTLTERLVAMPEFWWLLRNTQPARPVDVGEQFAELHPHGLDDAQQRLYLLNSLGATVRLPGGYYRLTVLGESCAADWGRSPNNDQTILEIEEGVGSLLDWALW